MQKQMRPFAQDSFFWKDVKGLVLSKKYQCCRKRRVVFLNDIISLGYIEGRRRQGKR